MTARVTEVAASFHKEFINSQSSITLVHELRQAGLSEVYGNDQSELERLPLTYHGFNRHPVLPNEDVQVIRNP